MKHAVRTVVLLCVLGLAPLARAAAPTYSIQLAPGEGTILLIGDKEQMAQVQKEYFSGATKKESVRKLDCLLLGGYMGTDYNYTGMPRKMGLNNDQYIGRVLKLYADLGSTAIFTGDGNMGGGVGQKFAAIAAQYGLKPIVQPGDLFFRDHRCWEFLNVFPTLKPYKNCEDYARRCLIPRLEANATPALAADKNIFAWQPTEELPPEDEAAYGPYKAAFKRLLPHHLIYQCDSQQADYERLSHKQRPYPDILAFDRYIFHTGPDGIGLWTPHFGTQWLFNAVKPFARAAWDLYRAPAVLVLQGPAYWDWVSKENGLKRGWQAREEYRYPKGDVVRWVPKVNKFLFATHYIGPENSYRLQHWIGIASGFKGLMYWSLGPRGPQGEIKLEELNPSSPFIGVIREDLSYSSHFDEIKASWKVIRRYEQLILDWHPVEDADAFYKVVTPQYVYTSALKDSRGRTYLVVVNGRIGEWDNKTTPLMVTPPAKTSLHVSLKTAELENYTPLKTPRTVELQIGSPSFVPYDLRTMTPVAAQGNDRCQGGKAIDR